jgi:thiol:disulfide interchange protein DsbD
LSLPAALLFALVGGLILNLMPCVFPVLAIKAMGLMGTAHDSRASRHHGLYYLAGVLASFLALGGLLLALRAAGEALGWGFQLQLPWVVGALAFLMLAMGLSLSGVFQIGGGWMNVGANLAQGGGARASFFNGVLAVIVASPCTAPLMGPALGWAVTQPAPLALLVFAALGLGLALPIVLLSFRPQLGRWLPRPGAWMETFKQAMAFPLYLTAIWLFWVLGRLVGIDGMGVALIGALILALGLWLLGRSSGRLTLRASGALTVLLALGTLPLVDRFGSQTAVAGATSASVHQVYSPQALTSARASGEPVLVNMTAAWCITCLANEGVALSSQRFRAALAEHQVRYLKGDWTHRDAAITEYLSQYQRNGVPLYVIYPRGGGPGKVLPQILTPDLVIDALAEAGQAPKQALTLSSTKE